jgi:pyruvate/2-oxoglutarate/acetoin dehydrogenase E1 component
MEARQAVRVANNRDMGKDTAVVLVGQGLGGPGAGRVLAGLACLVLVV